MDRGLVGRVGERWVKLIGIGVGWEAKEWNGAWSDGSVSGVGWEAKEWTGAWSDGSVSVG